ncbi:hypothetical protein CBR_g50931 [Chara braunii]|uniref:PIN domain-containing protein n=1 Tax=Chara braunii TaxID=69332 RepID=A0A388M7M5_CHABU|nr:hypothetical protein CBR_g50931 [Chara braunii]|eukprot:GBG90588.1 hypothetical protein CBR_g50931 [Chara braunii]
MGGEDTGEEHDNPFPPLGRAASPPPPSPSTPNRSEGGKKQAWGQEDSGAGGCISMEGKGKVGQTLADIVRKDTPPESRGDFTASRAKSRHQELLAEDLPAAAAGKAAADATAIYARDGGGLRQEGAATAAAAGGGGGGGGGAEVASTRGWSTRAPIQSLADQKAPIKTLVVDTNAIVKGVRLDRLGAEDVVTIREVLEEIRDREARRMIATLPFDLQCREPSDESLREVMRFARLTGDLHSLSATDVKLIALAHTLEVESHGAEHLHKTPPTVQVQTSRARIPDPPGWGKNVPNLKDWEAIDDAADAAPSAASEAKPSSSSRILPTRSLFAAAEDDPVNERSQPSPSPSPSPWASSSDCARIGDGDGGGISQGTAVTGGGSPFNVSAAAVGSCKEDSPAAPASTDADSRQRNRDPDVVEQIGAADGSSRNEGMRGVAAEVGSPSSSSLGGEGAVRTGVGGATKGGGGDSSVRRDGGVVDNESESKLVDGHPDVEVDNPAQVGPHNLNGLIIRDEDGEWERAVGRSTRRKYAKRAARAAAESRAADESRSADLSTPAVMMGSNRPGSGMGGMGEGITEEASSAQVGGSCGNGGGEEGKLRGGGGGGAPALLVGGKQSLSLDSCLQKTNAECIGHEREEVEGESATPDDVEAALTTAAAADSFARVSAEVGSDADDDHEKCYGDGDGYGDEEGEEEEGVVSGGDGSQEGASVSGHDDELFWGSVHSEAGGDDGHSSYAQPLLSSFQSSVACITLDFSMQNVILQMGLRLITVDGVRIKQVHRWALKCHACGLVTYEVTRLFCAKCGNGGTLNKVSVTVGPDGTTHVAVRRRISVRGTRYSLPLPKGGREGSVKNPILREDQLPERCRSAASRRSKSGVPDVFAPEYGPDTWFLGVHGKKKKQPPSAVHLKSVASMLTGRRNPNERRVARKH